MDIPVDLGYVAYFIMFYEGVGNLFPWNAFITASNYYGQRFCGTSFESNFENFFSITFTLSQTIGLVFTVLFQHKINMTNKIIWPLLCYSIIFGINTMLVVVTDIDPTLLFWVTLISACLCGLCGALLSGGLFGLGAMFPPVYTAALMNGNGLAGLTVAVSSMLTSLASSPIDDCTDDQADSEEETCEQRVDFSALAYFIIATLVLLSCILAFLGLSQLHFTKYYVSRAMGEIDDNDDRMKEVVNPFITEDDPQHPNEYLTAVQSPVHLEQPLSGGGAGGELEDNHHHHITRINNNDNDNNSGSTAGHHSAHMSTNQNSSPQRYSHSHNSHNSHSSSSPAAPRDMSLIEHAHTPQGRANSAEVLLSLLEGDQQSEDAEGDGGGGGGAGGGAEISSSILSYQKLKQVYQDIFIPSFSVFLVFAVTIGLFPSVIVLLESMNKCSTSDRFSNDLYVPFFFLLFNLFDFFGRMTAGAIPPVFTAKNIWIPAILRFIFFPLFLLCNIKDSQLPVVFYNDAFPIIFMIFMAYSNGYVASLSMMLGASAVNAHDAAIAGTIMILSLTLGLFMGAALSFPLVFISQGGL